MGSDLSYEDMMEERKLSEIYYATIVGEEKIEDRDVWKMELTALVDDINYFKRILWVDKQRYVPLKEDLFAKSGELLKRISFYQGYTNYLNEELIKRLSIYLCHLSWFSPLRM